MERQKLGLQHMMVRQSTHLLYGIGDANKAQSNAVVDLFRALYLQADQEQRVELLNNYWQLLWRAARRAGVASNSDYMKRLDAVMGTWWTFRQQYFNAALRRWVPFTRAWNDEIDAWSGKWQTFYEEAVSLAPEVARILTLQGIDPAAVSLDDTSKIVRALNQRTGQFLSSPLFWPVVGTVAALAIAGAGLKFYRKLRPPPQKPSVWQRFTRRAANG